MNQDKHPDTARHSVKTVAACGWTLVALGLVANEWLLAALFSPDGELSAANRTRIAVFDGACLVLGLAILCYRRRLADAGVRPALWSLAKRVGVAYLAAAVAFFSVLLALFALNLAMPYVWDLAQTEDAIRSEARWREMGETRHLVYPDLSNEEEAQLLAETWLAPYRYEAWVGFRERPRSGRFVNVSDEGFRHSATTDRTLDVAGLRIFVFGGSTTFGYGVDDASTIPTFLQAQLEERYPGVALEVFNFGRSFYYIGQETVLLFDLVRRGEIPDVVVFIDGVNEGQVLPFYTEEMERLFETYAARDDQALLNEVMERIPVTRFLRNGKRNVDYAADNFTRMATMLDPEQVRDAYVRDRELIRLLADHHGFAAYFALQPMPGYRNDFLHHPLQSERYIDSYEHTRRKLELLEEVMDADDSFSMTHLLEGFEGYAFVDQFHYTPAVCERIAAFLAERIDLAH